jgi:hypothetical protein
MGCKFESGPWRRTFQRSLGVNSFAELFPRFLTCYCGLANSKVSHFSIGRSERYVTINNPYQSAEEFLNQMDLGLLDGKMFEEVQKLPRELLEEIALVLIRRSSDAAGK